MHTSYVTERGASSFPNMLGLIRFEANACGLFSEEIDNAVIIFPKLVFPDIFGIEPIDTTSVLLFTHIEEEEEFDGRPGGVSYTANLWALEILEKVAKFRKTVCPQSRLDKVYLKFILSHFVPGE